jgi:outer membrane protein assembly factor BamE (lipoprotein component of BamABCDE complex)
MKVPCASLATVLLTACTALPTPGLVEAESARLARVHAGLTKEEVRRIAGSPDITTRASGAGAELWVYRTRDEWNDRAEYDLTFGPAGIVTDVANIRD